MDSREYWERRTADNLRYADTVAGTRLKELQQLLRDTYYGVAKEVDKLYLQFLAEEITTTNLYKFGRYAQLQRYIESKLKDIGDFQNSTAYRVLSDVYKHTLGATALELDTNFRWGFMQDSRLQTFLDSSYQGQHFSQRIWRNTDALSQRIQKNIRDNVALGRMPDAMKRDIMDSFGVGFRDADRLVRTETMRALNQGQLAGYQAAGVQMLQYLAGEDERMCPECGALHETQFPITDTENTPPVHPMCRCTVIPMVNLSNTFNPLEA